MSVEENRWADKEARNTRDLGTDWKERLMDKFKISYLGVMVALAHQGTFKSVDVLDASQAPYIRIFEGRIQASVLFYSNPCDSNTPVTLFFKIRKSGRISRWGTKGMSVAILAMSRSRFQWGIQEGIKNWISGRIKTLKILGSHSCIQ